VSWLDGRLSGTGTEDFPLGDYLREVLADGGCAAVICNTVRRAQRVYRELCEYFPDTACDGFPELDLFHARYPFCPHTLGGEPKSWTLENFCLSLSPHPWG
jgi:CRISPR-associated endonuclease/helicase Cas3